MNNKIIQILVPAVAVIVIFESIILVTNLEKNSNTTIVDTTPTTTVTQAETKINSFDLVLATDDAEMKVGKSYKVSVKLTAKQNYSLNALDLYVKYNPNAVTVLTPIALKSLGTPALLKVSDKKDVVAVNYLFTDTNGMAFTKDQEEIFLTFTVTPKIVGSSSFEISTGDSEGDSVTMFVDKSTSKSLDFSSNKLEVQFVK